MPYNKKNSIIRNLKKWDKTFIFMFSLNIIALIINVIVFDWFNKIHKCNCTDIPEGKYLKEWFIAMIVISILRLFYLIIFGYDNNILLILKLIITIINIVMIIKLLIYINKLKKIKCDCEMSKQENFIYYWYIFIFSLLSLFILILLCIFILLLITMSY